MVGTSAGTVGVGAAEVVVGELVVGELLGLLALAVVVAGVELLIGGEAGSSEVQAQHSSVAIAAPANAPHRIASG